MSAKNLLRRSLHQIGKHKSVIGTLMLLFFMACIEPVEPEFDFEDGLVTVDAFVSTAQGASFATIKKSTFDTNLRQYRNVFSSGAMVSFVNTVTGEVVGLIEDEEIYLPPGDFVASVGDTWELDITLDEGTKYKSTPETILEPVAITGLTVNYDPQITYREESRAFVPGHEISANFNDPANVENYYYWDFRSFETRVICAFIEEYAYTCETDCWTKRSNENIKIFSDEFVDGATVDQSAADVLLYTKEDILVEIQQSSISKSAYDYYKVLNDIVEGGTGLNAPPPAPLIGNMFNPDNNQEYVLGRFTAASTSLAKVFIERRSVNGDQIGNLELPDLDVMGEVPCIEGKTVTPIRPEDWP